MRSDTSGVAQQAHTFLLSQRMDTCSAEPQRSGWKQDLASLKHPPAHQKSSIKNLTSCCAIDLPRHAWVWREIGWVTGRVNRIQQGIHKSLINHGILKIRSGVMTGSLRLLFFSVYTSDLNTGFQACSLYCDISSSWSNWPGQCIW